MKGSYKIHGAPSNLIVIVQKFKANHLGRYNNEVKYIILKPVPLYSDHIVWGANHKFLKEFIKLLCMMVRN